MIKISLLLITIGILFISLENIFYQYIDENGFLHESLFMPIGIILLLIGTNSLVIIFIKRKISKKKRQSL